jgi:hypothetical protein
MASNQFNGLTMPVFSAFGWAGEEQALNFAISQLEQFIESLYFRFPRDTQNLFIAHGLDRASHSVYLATTDEPDLGLTIAFFTRPLSLEISLIINNKDVLAKTYRAADKQSETADKLLQGLSGWNMHVQQMEYDAESGERTHYQDVYKDSTAALDAEITASVFSRANYLNGEEKWVVPLYISHRTNSEKVAAMGLDVLPFSADRVKELIPLVEFFTGKVRKKKGRPKKKAKPKPETEAAETSVKKLSGSEEQFTYESELKSLHLQRGFVNLTPGHWPFFALNARTETRPVILQYSDQTDYKCSVWRLVQNDQARIVLSPPVHQWLEDNFEQEDLIKITASKIGEGKINIVLEIVE